MGDRGRRLPLGLGLLTAVGGLLDVGNLVANPQAGARTGTFLVPVIVLSGLAVALFSELAGRVAALGGPVGFELLTARLPRSLARANLGATIVVTAMTAAAEVGGLAQLAALATGIGARLWALPVAVALALVVWRASFHGSDTVLGLAGLGLVVVVVALVRAHPRWEALARGMSTLPRGSRSGLLALAVAQVGSMVVPYQLIFFASGAREEGLGRRRLGQLRANAWIGYAAGTFLAAALVTLTAALAQRGPPSITGLASVVHLAGRAGLGTAGEAVLGLSMAAAMTGAALETSLATGYMAAQFRGWPWSMDRSVREARAFFAVVFATLAVAGAVVAAGIDVVRLTDVSLVLSTVALPLTYGAVWAAARDGRRMGNERTGRAVTAAGALVVVLTAVTAVMAVASLVSTGGAVG